MGQPVQAFLDPAELRVVPRVARMSRDDSLEPGRPGEVDAPAENREIDFRAALTPEPGMRHLRVRRHRAPIFTGGLYPVTRLTATSAHLKEERKRVDELRGALADAVAAERIAAGEADALLAELDRRHRMGWL